MLLPLNFTLKQINHLMDSDKTEIDDKPPVDSGKVELDDLPGKLSSKKELIQALSS